MLDFWWTKCDNRNIRLSVSLHKCFTLLIRLRPYAILESKSVVTVIHFKGMSQELDLYVLCKLILVLNVVMASPSGRAV